PYTCCAPKGGFKKTSARGCRTRQASERHTAPKADAVRSGELCDGRCAARFESVVNAGPDRQRRSLDLHHARSDCAKRGARCARDNTRQNRASIKFSSSGKSELSSARERGRGFGHAISGGRGGCH